MPQPRLITVRRPRRPRAAVVVLHGGASRRGSPMVSPTQLSVLRMIPVAWRVKRSSRHLAVYRLLNSTRGWDAHHTPVDDARWAVRQVRDDVGDLPVGLVGHSLGGRAALLAARDPAVRSVVALNPWVYPHEDVGRVDGKDVLFVHGTHDRIADPRRATLLAAAMARTAAVSFVAVRGGRHAMLRRHRVFSSLAADFVRDTLLGRTSRGTLGRVRAGDAVTTVV